MTKNFYHDLDLLFKGLIKVQDDPTYSESLQPILLEKSIRYFYGLLIDDFFSRLRAKNVKESDAFSNNMQKINKIFAKEILDSKNAIKLSTKEKLDEEYYNNFKIKLKEQFPEHAGVISNLENEINIKKAKEYFSDKWEHMIQTGIGNSPFIIQILKKSISEYNRLLQDITYNELNKESVLDIEKFLLKTRRIIDQNSHDEMAVRGNKVQVFEKSVEKKWEVPFRLMDILIEMSVQIGDKVQKKLKNSSNNNKFQLIALGKINARSIQISSEILSLLKAGFADGAMARWRSLHELAVISRFLQEQGDEVSERYLEFEHIEEFRYAKKYKEYEKELGLKTIPTKDWDDLQREHDRLIKKHGDEFEYNRGYGWIPIAKLSSRNFRDLEKHVKLDRLRLFYIVSGNAIHGSSKGLRGLGLPEYLQNSGPLAGPSIYGLQPPLHLTADSLSCVTTSLLAVDSDLEGSLQRGILMGYYSDITVEAAKIQIKQEKMVEWFKDQIN